jgi:hypothetical protein
MQLSTEPAMRGRVMALRLGIALGGTPIGAPIVGWVADHLGPRWAANATWSFADHHDRSPWRKLRSDMCRSWQLALSG